jgi:putative SOS response-associated peptidase YedK
MPVIVDAQNYKHWLNKQTLPEVTQQILASDAYQRMELKPVSDWVNNPQHNDENCLN